MIISQHSAYFYHERTLMKFICSVCCNLDLTCLVGFFFSRHVPCFQKKNDFVYIVIVKYSLLAFTQKNPKSPNVDLITGQMPFGPAAIPFATHIHAAAQCAKTPVKIADTNAESGSADVFLHGMYYRKLATPI